MMSALLYIQRLVPIAGMMWNRMRFPGLWTGLRVEISGTGRLIYGKGVRLGEGTRIDLAPGSKLILGDGVVTGRGAYFGLDPGQQQTIGERTTIQDGCRFNGDIAIGRGCIFGPNVFVSTGSHTFDALPHLPIQVQERVAPSPQRTIRVLDDCWIGINAVLAPGVTVARGCVVGSNAVVTTNLQPYGVAAGVPARTIRKRLDFAPRSRIESACELDLPYFYDGFEFATGPREELTSDGDFSLALNRPGARTVRLCLSGDGADIWHGDVRQTIPRATGVIEFALSSGSDASPFLKFCTPGIARIRWAELT